MTNNQTKYLPIRAVYLDGKPVVTNAVNRANPGETAEERAGDDNSKDE
jgi:hypothetical protein